MWIASATTKKGLQRVFFINLDSIFVLLGQMEELGNFGSFNKRSGGMLGRRILKFESC